MLPVRGAEGPPHSNKRASPFQMFCFGFDGCLEIAARDAVRMMSARIEAESV